MKRIQTMDRTTVQDALNPDCPIRNVLARIGDKWSLLVIVTLSGARTMRFGALQRAIPDISQKMLSVTLRTLEEDGYLTRQVYPEVPPRVEYSLTSRAPMRIWPIFSTTARLRAGSGDETARSVPVRNRRPANHDAPPCCYFLQQGGASRSGVRCTRNAFRSYRCRNSKVNWLPSSVSQACCRVVGERANRGE